MVNDISSITRATAPGSVAQPIKLVAPNPENAPKDGTQVSQALDKNQPQADAGKKVSAADIQESVKQINRFVQTVQRDLSFNLDERSGRTVIRVLDSESGELIRQIPQEEVLSIANHLRTLSDANVEQIPQGILFSESI